MWQAKRILVVEDEPLIAVDLEAALVEAGATIVGPAHTLEQALRLGQIETLDGAIVDMRLRGESAMPLLACLVQRAVPCVVHSGHSELTSAEKWPGDIPIVTKPASVKAVLSALLLRMGG